MIIMCAIVMPSRLRRIPSQRSDPCDCLLKIIHGTMFHHSVPVAGGGCYLEKNIDLCWLLLFWCERRILLVGCITECIYFYCCFLGHTVFLLNVSWNGSKQSRITAIQNVLRRPSKSHRRNYPHMFIKITCLENWHHSENTIMALKDVARRKLGSS